MKSHFHENYAPQLCFEDVKVLNIIHVWQNDMFDIFAPELEMHARCSFQARIRCQRCQKPFIKPLTCNLTRICCWFYVYIFMICILILLFLLLSDRLIHYFGIYRLSQSGSEYCFFMHVCNDVDLTVTDKELGVRMCVA